MKKWIIIGILAIVVTVSSVVSGTEVQVQSCPVKDCTQTGEHEHYRCEEPGCTEMSEHEHYNCGVENCDMLGKHHHDQKESHHSGYENKKRHH